MMYNIGDKVICIKETKFCDGIKHKLCEILVVDSINIYYFNSQYTINCYRKYLNLDLILSIQQLLNQREEIQNDLLTVFHGMSEDVCNEICRIVIDRFDILFQQGLKK